MVAVEKPRESRSRKERNRASEGGAGIEQGPGHRLLHERRPAANLDAGGQTDSPSCTEGLASASAGLWNTNAAELRKHLGGAPRGNPELLHLQDLNRSLGGDEHEDPSHETASLWVPRH